MEEVTLRDVRRRARDIHTRLLRRSETFDAHSVGPDGDMAATAAGALRQVAADLQAMIDELTVCMCEASEDGEHGWPGAFDDECVHCGAVYWSCNQKENGATRESSAEKSGGPVAGLALDSDEPSRIPAQQVFADKEDRVNQSSAKTEQLLSVRAALRECSRLLHWTDEALSTFVGGAS